MAQAPVDVSEPTSARNDDVLTELNLADELLAACLGVLSLRDLPSIARVNHRWHEAAQVAFAPLLGWRAEARCLPLPLPVPNVPARAGRDSQIRQEGRTRGRGLERGLGVNEMHLESRDVGREGARAQVFRR